MSQRLARLADAPLEIAPLLAAIEHRLPRRPRSLALVPGPLLGFWHWLTPLRTTAVFAIFGLALVILLHLSSRPALASVQMLVDFHHHMSSATGHCLPADSAASANAALASQAFDAPPLPDFAATNLTPTCCCVHHQGNCPVSCLCCCQADGCRLTLVVGDDRRIRPPAVPSRNIAGLSCQVASLREDNLCLMRHGDRWVCLIGPVPLERLAQLAAALRW